MEGITNFLILVCMLTCRTKYLKKEKKLKNKRSIKVLDLNMINLFVFCLFLLCVSLYIEECY